MDRLAIVCDLPAVSAKPDAVDPRRARTREAILRAGEDLFGRHYPEGVSTDELIRVAKVSKQSFYNHFTDKDEVVHEIIHRARAEIDATVAELNLGEGDPARRLATGLCVYARQAQVNPARGRLIARLMPEDTSADSDTNLHVVGDVTAGLTQHRLAVFTLETGLTFIIGAGQALMSRIVAEQHPAAALAITQQFVTLVLRAFGLAPIEAELIAAEAADRVMRPRDR